jgi:hypothetical protein
MRTQFDLPAKPIYCLEYSPQTPPSVILSTSDNVLYPTPLSPALPPLYTPQRPSLTRSYFSAQVNWTPDPPVPSPPSSPRPVNGRLDGSSSSSPPRLGTRTPDGPMPVPSPTSAAGAAIAASALRASAPSLSPVTSNTSDSRHPNRQSSSLSPPSACCATIL